MSYKWKKYKRTGIAEMRPLDRHEILTGKLPMGVSVSDEDKENGSPKAGDMIARNPDNHNDQWLVAEEYFNNNFRELDESITDDFPSPPIAGDGVYIPDDVD